MLAASLSDCRAALHRAYRRGIDVPVTLLKKDIAAKSFRAQRKASRKQRFQEVIEGMLTGVLPAQMRPCRRDASGVRPAALGSPFI
jgi:hypothetical protein